MYMSVCIVATWRKRFTQLFHRARVGLSDLLNKSSGKPKYHNCLIMFKIFNEEGGISGFSQRLVRHCLVFAEAVEEVSDTSCP